jgi:hypothetical protein
MTTLQQTLQAIAHLAELPDNWDTYGSPTIRPAALESARRVVAAIECPDLPEPQVSPVAGGGIGLTWNTGNRELLVELLPDGSVEYLMVQTDPRTGEEEEQEGKVFVAEPQGLRSLAVWLCAG